MNKKNIAKLIKEKLKSIIEIISCIVSVISVILVYLTLKEMQVQRDNTYRPDLVLEPTSIELSWQDLNEKGNTERPQMIGIKMYNIGVGVAKDIRIKFDMNDVGEWVDILKEKGIEDCKYKITNNAFEFQTTSSLIDSTARVILDKSYLLPSAKESYMFQLPLPYTILIREFYENKLHNNIPDIKLEIQYEDVQGKKYMQKVLLEQKQELSEWDGSDSNKILRAEFNIQVKE